MDFARKQLESMGWSEGKGLGKNEDGITKALKARCKQDVFGLGYELSNEISTQVWFAKIDDVIASSKKSGKRDGESKAKMYSKFVQSEEGATTLTNESEPTKRKKRKKAVVAEDEVECSQKSKGLNLDEVFIASGGRTCHKGARHGVNMNAKLERLEAQEREFLEKYGNGTKGK
jgi:hypothetical protein